MKTVASVLLLLLFPFKTNLYAYGPRSVSVSGDPVKWTSPVRIDLESDLDVRGKDVTALLDEGLSQWTSLGDVSLSFNRQEIGVAVDADNVCCYLYEGAACPSGPLDDGKNPIVIDDDGLVVAKFFGKGNRFTTLGFAAIISSEKTTGAAGKGEAVFNAACLAGVESDGCGTLSFSDNDFTSFIVHEIGHFLGLNHAQVNFTEADDTDTSNDDKITTMYPFFIQGNGVNFKTPERDDEVGLAFLYPASDFSSSTFTIKGTVKDDDGTTEFACANIVARNSDAAKSRSDAISFVSGQMCPDETFDGSCDGDYEIRGLNPNATYTLEIEPIAEDVEISSGIPPCDGTTEQPTFTSQTRSGTLNNSAGSTTTGVDFTLANTSANVNSLVTLLDSESTASLETSPNWEAILTLESKSATDSCSSTGGNGGDTLNDDSSSGGCSLIRRKHGQAGK